MSYNAADFLAGLFEDGPAPSLSAIAIQADQSAVGGKGCGDERETAADSAPTTNATYAWMSRPDVDDRLGLEPLDLRESARWWAETSFDELPAADWTCASCGELAWWESLTGRRRCLACDPPTRSRRLAARATKLRGAREHLTSGK